MNEYQERDARKYQKSLGRLHLIVDELNDLDLGDVTEFKIQPVPDDCDFTPRYIAISALIMEGPIEIMCERDGYGNNGRWEFRAAGWPTYTDQNGKTCTVDPSNLWRPRPSRPTTTAAQDRPCLAIAKQIASKLIPEYIEVYKRCVNSAEECQDHAAKEEEALQAVTEAAGQTYEQGKDRNRDISVRKGDEYIRVEFRSTGDVILHVTSAQAITALEAIR